MLGILETISPSELVSNGYISNESQMESATPTPKIQSLFIIYIFAISESMLLK